MSLLEKLCKELGVEIEEVWVGNSGSTYKIDKSGEVLRWKNNDGWVKSIFTLQEIVLGELKPVYQPKFGDAYYYPEPHPVESCRYDVNTWGDNDWNYWHLKNNMVFETKEEAIDASNKMIASLKNK